MFMKICFKMMVQKPRTLSLQKMIMTATMTGNNLVPLTLTVNDAATALDASCVTISDKADPEKYIWYDYLHWNK